MLVGPGMGTGCWPAEVQAVSELVTETETNNELGVAL